MVWYKPRTWFQWGGGRTPKDIKDAKKLEKLKNDLEEFASTISQEAIDKLTLTNSDQVVAHFRNSLSKYKKIREYDVSTKLNYVDRHLDVPLETIIDIAKNIRDPTDITSIELLKLRLSELERYYGAVIRTIRILEAKLKEA